MFELCDVRIIERSNYMTLHYRKFESRSDYNFIIIERSKQYDYRAFEISNVRIIECSNYTTFEL